ncbi:glycoside hydrolase family 2, partial [bacterium]|nr:glycoside hydrolase family 2 [bacterium]
MDIRVRVGLAGGLAVLLVAGVVAPHRAKGEGMDAERGPVPTSVTSLDGEWRLATDPGNVGRDERWFAGPRPDARPCRVPWIIQDAFPGYHGVAWYWRSFTAPANPHSGGRMLLRFWQVDYKADVWLNGARIGEHEGAESPFVFDVTDRIKPGAANLLAVRVLNPTHKPIDGIVLKQTPHRNKAIPYSAGASWNHGGIVDSVELLATPAIRVADLFVQPDWMTGIVQVRATLRNAAGAAARARVEFTIAPAARGTTLGVAQATRELAPGDSAVEAQLRVEHPRLWQLNDPFLYRVTARVTQEGSRSLDEQSARCGFRDFRFADGYFRLNGRRIYLRCSHTGNHCPIGMELPHDPDVLRRDLLHVKAMRFNAIRFIAGVAKRQQLDLCDELGLLVYEESYAAWLLEPSPKMAERWDESVLGMIRRDRNHPSIVIWGLLNETNDGPVFRHAVGALPRVRQLDRSRLVMLNSGRWDLRAAALADIDAWQDADRVDPNVTRNRSKDVAKGLGVTWQPGQMAFHPGAKGEYSVVRWTAPAAGKVAVGAAFAGIAGKATTDVHVAHNATQMFAAYINVHDGGNAARYASALTVKAGDTLDCIVGYGNGNYGGDTTAIALTITLPDGTVHDAAADFTTARNPNGPWSYGRLAPGERLDAASFALYARGRAEEAIGSLSNPGSAVWEDVLHDQHPYPRVPHTADTIRHLRTMDGNGRPLFISEYGIGSAVDLVRVVRHYEQLGKGEAEDARFFRGLRDRFLADWREWKLDEAFARPEDYFAQCVAKMAGQRLIGLNAIRANPHCVAHSLTGTVDQGMTGEGLTTTFRELKPGTVDALFDAFAPLRWCLFAEPAHVYRKTRVRLEAVLANEDALRPGEYPVRVQVVGPNAERVFERRLTVTVP